MCSFYYAVHIQVPKSLTLISSLPLGDLITYHHHCYNIVLVGESTNFSLGSKFGHWIPHSALRCFDALGNTVAFQKLVKISKT